jgi:hypothetical protein
MDFFFEVLSRLQKFVKYEIIKNFVISFNISTIICVIQSKESIIVLISFKALDMIRAPIWFSRFSINFAHLVSRGILINTN